MFKTMHVRTALIGSHNLGENTALDVVGNAAALDVYKFLRESHNGQSSLNLLLASDANVKAALSDDAEVARQAIRNTHSGKQSNQLKVVIPRVGGVSRLLVIGRRQVLIVRDGHALRRYFHRSQPQRARATSKKVG
jgi:hypothetical protein